MRKCICVLLTLIFLSLLSCVSSNDQIGGAYAPPTWEQYYHIQEQYSRLREKYNEINQHHQQLQEDFDELDLTYRTFKQIQEERDTFYYENTLSPGTCGLTYFFVSENEDGELYIEFHFCTLNRPFDIRLEAPDAYGDSRVDKEYQFLFELNMRQLYTRNFPLERLFTPWLGIPQAITDVPDGFEGAFNVIIERYTSSLAFIVGSDFPFELESGELDVDPRATYVKIPLGIRR